MNWLDVFIVLIVLLGALSGLRRGFLRGALDLLVIVISLVAAAFGYAWTANLIQRLIDLPELIANILAFALVAGIVQTGLTLALLMPLTPVVRTARALPTVRWVDNAMGAVPGAFKGLALAAALALAVALLPFSDGLGTGLTESVLGRPLVRAATDLTYQAQEKTNIDLADFTVMMSPGDEHGRRLPFTITSGLESDPEAEGQILDLINDERVSRGLEPLRMDDELRAVARRHSVDMLENGYFAHVSPAGGTPTDRLTAAQVDFLVAGENLAYAPSVPIAHRSLMNSEGHRANILSSDYTRVGIGVIVTPFGSKMISQEFAGP